MADAVLLRCGQPLAEAMDAAAEEAGVSRHTWMVGVLQSAVEAAGHVPVLPHADDEPLPGVG